MPTVTKKDLVQEVSRHTPLTQAQAAEVLEALTQIIASHLKAGNDVAIRGFGSFRVKAAPSRIGRDLSRPSQTIQIPEHCVVKFKPCQQLRCGVRIVDTSKIALEE